nr:RNA polymerase subunit sigma-70 [Leptolyngbyaceae cyanobacterium MAG.088]
MDARRAAELAARNSYGRLVAYLAVRSHDISAAEDALGDAFLKALNTWPDKGVPNNPEAWLLVTARRRLIDVARRSQTHAKILNTLNLSGVETPDSPSDITFPDERLKLLFICAHPAIHVNIRTPLMLQTVMGLNAAQIGSAFLVAPTTMGQRLVRAKAKIRDAGI